MMSATLPQPRPPAPLRPVRPLRRALPLLLAALLAALSAGACTPTEGDDGIFDPHPTTNKDFGKPTFVQVGNFPLTLDATPKPSVGTVQYVAVANNLDSVDPLNGNGSVTVLINSAGTLSLLTTLPTGYGPTQVLFGDFGGAVADGSDIAVLDDSNKRVSVFLNTGAGTWATSAVSVTLGGTAAMMAVADLDADGLDDLVFTVPGREDIVALMNGGVGVFTEALTPAKANLGRFVIEDFNGDPYPDLAVVRSSGGELYLWTGNLNGIFSAALPASIDGLDGPTYLTSGDLDGDLDIDLAVVSTTIAKITVVLNQTGAADFKEKPSIALNESPGRVFVGDVDAVVAGQDLVVLHPRQRYVTVLRSNNASYSSSLQTTTRNPVAAVMGDLTAGDNDPDLIIAEEDQRLLAVLAGNGSGGFSRSEIGFTSHPAFVMQVDLDGLGKLDLLMVQPRADKVVYLLNEN